MGKKRPAAEISGQGSSGQGRNGNAEKCCEARETMVLDPEGDVTITIMCSRCDEDRRFRASSQVLSLASPVFAKMLGPNFQEGHQLRKEGRITIALHDDDPDAVETVLCALHYHPKADTLFMHHTKLVPIALFSDKYDCSRALAPWVPHWCQVRPSTDVTGAAYTLLAAYLFRATNFYDISSRIALCLPPDFASSWKKLEKMDLLPEHLTSALSAVVADKITFLHRGLQITERSLRAKKEHFAMRNLHYVCTSCGHRGEEHQWCSSCDRGLIFKERVCTADFRISEYFRILAKYMLWPSIDPFSTCTLSELSTRFSRAHKGCSHRCEADQSCPLRELLRQLWDNVDLILKGIDGIHIEGDLDIEDEFEEDDRDQDEEDDGGGEVGEEEEE